MGGGDGQKAELLRVHSALFCPAGPVGGRAVIAGTGSRARLTGVEQQEGVLPAARPETTGAQECLGFKS